MATHFCPLGSALTAPPFSIFLREQWLLMEMGLDSLEAFVAAHSSSSLPAELTVSQDINSSDSSVNRWWSLLPRCWVAMPW